MCDLKSLNYSRTIALSKLQSRQKARFTFFGKTMKTLFVSRVRSCLINARKLLVSCFVLMRCTFELFFILKEQEQEKEHNDVTDFFFHVLLNECDVLSVFKIYIFKCFTFFSFE